MLHKALDNVSELTSPGLVICSGGLQHIPNIIQSLFDFFHFIAHGRVQGCEVDRVAPVVVDRDAGGEVLHLVVPSARASCQCEVSEL